MPWMMICIIIIAPVGGWCQTAKTEAQKQSPVDEKTFVLGDQNPSQTNQAAAPVGGFGIWDFVRMVLVLAGVVGLIYGFFHIQRRTTLPKKNASAISVLETQNLSGNKNLHLVEAGTHLFLLGSAEDGVRLVAEIIDQESIDEIRLKLSQKPVVSAVPFAEMVRKAFRPKARPPVGQSVDVSMDFMRKQKERLKKLK
jgi:flagellar biogenesis protein FliO